MADVLQRIACKAVIVRDGKVLVLREASTYAEGTAIGRWTCPGGRINPGEPFLDGLYREVYEETGLKVQAGDPLCVSEWFPTIHGQQNQIVAIFFACLSPSGEVRLSEEHDAYKWVDAAEAAKLDLLGEYREAISKYFQAQSK